MNPLLINPLVNPFQFVEQNVHPAIDKQYQSIPNTKHLSATLTHQDYATAINQLLSVSFGESNQSKCCAMVLLASYTDSDFRLRFSDLITLDEDLYSASLVVIRSQVELRVELHEAIDHGLCQVAELYLYWAGDRYAKIGAQQ